MTKARRTSAAHLASARQSLALITIAAAVFAFIAIIIGDINDKLDVLVTVQSNNFEQQFIRLEIDHLVLMRTADTAQTAADLPELRDRFDEFHSLLTPLRTGRAFSDLRDDPAFATALDSVADTIDAAVPIMDGPDAALLRALPALRSDFTDIADDMRTVVETGIRHFSGRVDNGHISAAGTLRRLGLLTVALMGLLLAVITHMWQLYRTAHQSSVAAERSAARMATVVENALDGVIITDSAGKVQDFNRAAETIFGCRREALIGQHVDDTPLPSGILPAAGPAATATPDMPPPDGDAFVTVAATRQSGQAFPLEVAVTTSRDPDGAEMTVYFLRDITARANADRELRAARDAALAGERAKQRLLTVMSHEMRTPLNGILASVELLQGTAIDEKQAKYLSAIADSGSILLGHVDDVLDISRMDSGSAVGAGRPIDIGAIIHEVVAELRPQAEANGTTIRVSLPDDTRVIGDPIALRRVLANLVGNSAKFTFDGSVDISADRLGTEDVVEFCIADTGIGIDPRDQARIFDDFTTLDSSYDRVQSGTGLGLGVVQRLVRQMGGDIGLESEPGEGSLFWVRVPLPRHVSMPHVSDAAAADADDSNRPNLEVLVVEDNEINRLVVRELLEAAGHTVTEALDGRAGVEAAETRRFDLILMDISMPRMDGVEATRRIRSGEGPCRDTPIVALTANALLHEVSIFRDVGMNETITKPISRRSLERALVLAGELQVPLERQDRDTPPQRVAPAESAPPAPRARDDATRHAKALDQSQLDTLRAEIGRGRADALLGRFIAEADTAIADLNGRGVDDVETVLAAVHKLAGSAAMFGAARLHGRLREFDGMGKTGRGAEVPPRLRELAEIWSETRPVLEDARSSSEPADH